MSEIVQIKDSERTQCEIWKRVCGYMRPQDSFNIGKMQEALDRNQFSMEKIEAIAA